MKDPAIEAFTPGTTVSLSATTSSANVALPAPTGKLKTQLRLYNAGSVVVFVKIGQGPGLAAATSDMPLAPGVPEIVSVPDAGGATIYLAGITASSSGTVYATSGEGF